MPETVNVYEQQPLVGSFAASSTSGAVAPVSAVDLPGEGRTLRLPAGRTAQDETTAPLLFTAAADPTDIDRYHVSAEDILDPGETLADYTAIGTPEAGQFGVLVGMPGTERAPVFTPDRKGMIFWIYVDPTQQGANRFSRAGVPVGIELTFLSNAAPQRRIQRTVTVTIRQR